MPLQAVKRSERKPCRFGHWSINIPGCFFYSDGLYFCWLSWTYFLWKLILIEWHFKPCGNQPWKEEADPGPCETPAGGKVPAAQVIKDQRIMTTDKGRESHKSKGVRRLGLVNYDYSRLNTIAFVWSQCFFALTWFACQFPFKGVQSTSEIDTFAFDPVPFRLFSFCNIFMGSGFKMAILWWILTLICRKLLPCFVYIFR